MDDPRIKDMEATDDGSMVKVVMTDEVIRKSEPYRYLGVDQALDFEARGICKIVRRKTNQKENILVEHLQESLVKSYGKYRQYPREKAEEGEKKSKWKIIEDHKLKIEPPRLSIQDLYNQPYETKGVDKKTVAWIQDDMKRGGAEISNELVIRTGLDCGFKIFMATPSMPEAAIEDILAKSDFAIINNIWAFRKNQIDLIERFFLEGDKPYVKYEHDHREIRRPEFSKKLFSKSVLNVFISPVHLENHKKALGIDGICLPLAIDTDFFRPMNGEARKTNTAITCNVRRYKGWNNLQSYIYDHPKIEFTIMIDGDLPINGGNVKKRKMVAYEEMPKIYSEFEYLVHLMDDWGAGERVVFEAALCGCKIVANDKVGHTSWNRDFSNTPELREWLRAAPYDFWKEVDKRL